MSWFRVPRDEPKEEPKKNAMSLLPTPVRAGRNGARGACVTPREQRSKSCWGMCCGPPSGVLEDDGCQPAFSRTLLPFCADLCDEFRREKLTLCVLSYEREWVKQYGESMFSASRCQTILLKATIAVVMLWGQWLSLFGWGDNAKYYGIYLTFWTLTVQNAYHILNLVMAIQATVSLTGKPFPYTLQLTTALRGIVEPCALIVTALYTVGTRFEDTSLSNIMVHGVNGAVVLLDALAGRQTSRLFNNLWGYVYVACYLVWTLVHYAMHIGDPSGNRCIYDGFCWETPQVAIVNFLLIFVVLMPTTSLLIWSLVWLRDKVISDTDRQRYLAANPTHDPQGSARVMCQALCCILPLVCLLVAFWAEKGCHLGGEEGIYTCKHEGGPLESIGEAILSPVKALATRAWEGLMHVQQNSTTE